MPYEIVFFDEALEAWEKLDNSVRMQFKKKLAKLIDAPYVKNSELVNELKGSYKIKINSTGHRLVYQVDEAQQQLQIIAVGHRNGKQVYLAALDILRSVDPQRMRE